MIRVIVNRHTINRNRNTGSDAPPISIYRSGQSVETAREVELKGNVKLIYRPDKPLPNGARVWIEADEVEVLTA